MNDRSVFHLVSELTQKHDVPSVLIGGFAVNYYQVSRQTADIDFLITREGFDKIIGSLEKAGYKASTQEVFAQLKSSRAPLMDIDFMFVDDETLAKIRKEGRPIKIAGQNFTVPSLEHLIALKLHAIKHNRKNRLIKDLPDIVSLIRINKMDVKGKKFKKLCLKYGTDEIYQKIMETLQ